MALSSALLSLTSNPLLNLAGKALGVDKKVAALKNIAKEVINKPKTQERPPLSSFANSGSQNKPPLGNFEQGATQDDATKQKLISQYGYTDENFKNIASVGQTPESALLMEERKKKQKENMGPEYPTGKVIGDVANWVSEGTVKPIGKFAAGAAVTGAKDVEALGKLLYELPGALKESGGDWNKPIAGLGDKIKAINAKAGEKVELPWVGNVNMNRMDDKGKLDFIKTLTTEAATGGDAFLGMLNIVSPTTRAFSGGILKNAALRGGLQAAAHEATNEDSNLASVATAGTAGAVLSGVFQGVFNKVFKPKEVAQKISEKTGLDVATIEQVRKLPPEMRQKQADMLGQAFEYRLKPDEAQTPMQSLADQVTDEMRQLNKIKQAAGAGIGKVKEGVRFGKTAKIDMTGIKDTFKQNLDDLRIGFNPIEQADELGAMNFTKSKIKNLLGDQEILTNAWNEIKNANNLDDLIVARDSLRSEMTFGRMNQKITVAEGVLKKLDRAITDTVHAERPDLADLDDTFSELARAVTAFQAKAGSKTQFTVDDAMDGTNLYNILRRSLGAGNQENLKLVQKLQALGIKYNLPTLSKIVNLRRMAQTAEDVAKVDLAPGSTTLASRLMQGVRGVKQTPTSPIEGVSNVISAIKTAPKQKEALLKLLEKPPTEGLRNKLMNNVVVKKALPFLKKYTPILSLKAGASQNLTQSFLDILKQAFGGGRQNRPPLSSFARQ